LVEDQSSIRRALSKYLNRRDELEFIGSAATGEDGVRAVLADPPEVLLLDLELPGLDGIGVLEAVHDAEPSVKVLILTTFDDEEKVYEAITKGASGYLVKRTALEQVVEAICEVAQGGVVIESRIAKRFWNFFQSVQGRNAPEEEALLSEEELVVLRYIAKGLSNAEVGQVMEIERRRVRTHLTHIYEKLEVSSHVAAVVEGLRRGLIEL